MKKLLLILGIVTSLLFSVEVYAKNRGGGHIHVDGYVKRNGTYVQPHYRTAPDGVKTNNWSYSGNINPYTGKVGTSTNSSSNYRGAGYSHSALPVNNDYTVISGELHNHRTASFYTD